MGGNSQRYRRAKFCKIRELALFTVARSAMYAFNCEMSVTQMAETYSEGFFPSPLLTPAAGAVPATAEYDSSIQRPWH
jgi:hypothetical protein